MKKSMKSFVQRLVWAALCTLPLLASARSQSQILFVDSNGTNEVKRYNANTGAYLGNIEGGHGLDLPSGLYADASGVLYVGSYNTGQINRYDAGTGAFLDTFVTPNSGGLLNPTGLTFGPDGNLYVISSGNASVKEYNGQTGAYMRDFEAPFQGGVRNDSYDLVFGPDGSLYVSSYLEFRVSKLHPDGTLDFTFQPQSGVAPVGLTIGPAFAQQTDSLVLADGVINGATSLDLTQGTYLGRTQISPEYFPFPWGVRFAPNDGDLFVSFLNLNVVRRYNRLNGAYEGDFVAAGSGGLDMPSFIEFTSVPEPGSLALLAGMSISGAGFLARRRKNARKAT